MLSSVGQLSNNELLARVKSLAEGERQATVALIAHLAEGRLNALGHEVVVTHRGQTAAALPCNVQEILGDRYHVADRAGQLKDLAPDIVLDMIPLGRKTRGR